jgi:hypothetical protein
MAKKVPLNETKKFTKGEPLQVISTSAADISVSVRSLDGTEHLSIFENAAPSDFISTSSFAHLKEPLPPDQQEKFVESIGEAKKVRGTYFKKLKFALASIPKLGLKFIEVEIERAPKEIRVYKRKVQSKTKKA